MYQSYKSDAMEVITNSPTKHFSVREKTTNGYINWGKVSDLGPTRAHWVHIHISISDHSLAQSVHLMHVLKEVLAINILFLFIPQFLNTEHIYSS